MAERTRRIFISDIHMGDQRSFVSPNSYVWFRDNVALLAGFLNAMLQTPDVREVIILGDLFDQWIVPADFTPITKLEAICSNPVYDPVIQGLKALAASGDITLTYVPGNHDMSLEPAAIKDTRQFFEDFFRGINFCGEKTGPLGTYKSGVIAAEHGNRYCLFNAPDLESNSGGCFLPLGYFISRLDAYKVCRTGLPCGVFDVFAGFVREYLKGNTNFVEDVFLATARECGLLDGAFQVAGLPGYGDEISVALIASRFMRIATNWAKAPGREKVDALMALEAEELGLFAAARAVYLHDAAQARVVVFGHTHTAEMQRAFENPGNPNYIADPDTTPCRTIYANSGAWVDSARYGCTYVETREENNRLRVSVKGYPENVIINGWRGFLEI